MRPFFIALCAAVILLLSYSRVFERYELQTYDWRFQLRGPRPVHQDIVHIDIWNDTLGSLGVWPFDRVYHAYLIQALSEYGARAIVFDVLFSEEHPSDLAVVQAAKAAGNVYFASSFSGIKSVPGKVTAQNIDSDVVPAYRAVAKGVGFVNTKADLDGKRRRVMPVISYTSTTPGGAGNAKDYYQLSFQVLFDILGTRGEDIEFKPGKYIRLSKDLKVPLDEDGCLNVNYAGPWEATFSHYSYFHILSSYKSILDGEKPKIDLRQFKNKICFVGLTAQGSQDISPVTVQTVYPMVGTYSNIVNTVLQKDFIRRLDRKTNLFILIFIVLCTAWVSFYKKPQRSFLYALAILTVFMLAVINFFIYLGVWVDLFYPVVVITIVYGAGTLTRIIQEIRKRELMESELKIASQIQQSFLPASLPAQKGIQAAVFMKPAKAVGGDLYMFVPLGDEKIGIMVGDVSGKGTPAALFMGKVVSEFKFSAREQTDPAQTLTKLNDSIAAESTGGLFVTLCYAIFDLKNKKMTLSNGGHLPVVVASSGKSAELLSADGGMPIGVMEGAVFANYERPVGIGECYAFYSDGISEARNRKKEEYGVEQLQQVLMQYHVKPAQVILDNVIQNISHFTGKAEQHDDMTLIIVQIVGEV
jgi:CHASE2 domain-containing sensor protein